MFLFIKNFLSRGYTILFSYISWQVPSAQFKRLANITLLAIFVGLAFGIFL